MRQLFAGTAATKGATSIEYALLAGLVSVALMGPAEALGRRLSATSDAVSYALDPSTPELRLED